MKLLIVDRKKLGIVIIMIGLMVVMLGLFTNLDEKLKSAVLLQNDIKALKQYEYKNEHFYYKLPENWTTQEQKFEGGEIIYHNNFKSEDSNIQGFTEIWNTKSDLKQFIEDSKAIALQNGKFKYFNVQPVNFNGKEGYLLNYDMLTPGNKYYVAYEYMFKGKDRFYRVSFFVNEKNYNEGMAALFKTIAETLRY